MTHAVPPTLGALGEQKKAHEMGLYTEHATYLCRYGAGIAITEANPISRALLTVRLRRELVTLEAFVAQLAGPFSLAASIGLTPYPDSLCRATRPTLPGHGC